MKHFFFLFLFILLISCDQKHQQELLPYGYYEDKHWEDLETYGLKGDVKSRISSFNAIPEGTYSFQTDEFRLLQSVEFDRKGYLILSKETESPFKRDSIITELSLLYSKDPSPKLLKVTPKSPTGSSTKFIWDSENRLKEVIIVEKGNEDKLLSKIVYEYLGNTNFKIKESKYEKSPTPHSYIDYSYNEKGQFLGWKNYWGKPIRLVESNTLHYDKKNKLVGNSFYYALYDSLKPITYKYSIKSNQYNQPLEKIYLSPKNDSIIEQITSYKYDANNRIISEETKRIDSTLYEMKLYLFKNDLLISDKSITKYSTDKDTSFVQNQRKYDHKGNIIELVQYSNEVPMARITFDIDYYKE
jgi:hypothetical protein